MTWDMEKLGNRVAARYDTEQRGLLIPCSDSLMHRQHFAYYHRAEVTRLLTEVGQADTVRVIELVNGWANEDEVDEFERAVHAAWAHTLAWMQNLHAIDDTLAHVVYFSLGLNKDKDTELKKEQSIDLTAVRKIIRGSHPDLVRLLDQLCTEGDHAYVAAAVNYSKHRSVVPAKYGFGRDASDPESHGFELQTFKRGNDTYPAKWVDQVLPQEHYRVFHLVGTIGNVVNQTLGA